MPTAKARDIYNGQRGLLGFEGRRFQGRIPLERVCDARVP